MTNAIQYLEAAKIEEVAEKLRGEGYQVTVEDEGYDIVAKKDDKKMAVEVKVNDQLQKAAESIKSLRKRAIESGYDEFRLVVVNPPRDIEVRIDGLETELREYLMNNPTEELDELSDHLEIDSLKVVEFDVDSIEVTDEGTHVAGNGVLVVSLHFGRFGEVSEPMKNYFPFKFDVQLDLHRKISKVYKIEVDTSSLDK